jgi:hypothetical protein
MVLYKLEHVYVGCLIHTHGKKMDPIMEVSKENAKKEHGLICLEGSNPLHW